MRLCFIMFTNEVFFVICFILCVKESKQTVINPLNLGESGQNVCTRRTTQIESYYTVTATTSYTYTKTKCGLWGWGRCGASRPKTVYRSVKRTRRVSIKIIFCCSRWKKRNPSTRECTEAICSQGCDSSHGSCVAPNTCRCSTGYTGNTCVTDIDECAASNGGCDQVCTNTPGSYQCGCHSGYTKHGHSCQAVECEKLVAPINGGFRAACGNVYDSVCEFQCNSGYILVGSRSRRCQSDKTWSGTAVQCKTNICAVLPAQAYGTKTCTGKGYEYGDSCTFTCDVGYERKGSATRSCQPDRQWSGQQTTCEARMCPALRQLAFGTIEPVDCATKPQPYQRGCIMKCVVGYVMTGDSPLICGADGTWQGTFPKCEDKQPPIITCPADVTGETDPGRPTRTVTWNDPVVSDNSELHDPNAAPTVVRTPNNIASPYEFPIGTTLITYTATERSNNVQSCIFAVTVEDKEPPTIYCPQNQEIKNKGDSVTVKVYWPPPTYRDNSGQNVTVFTESINGSNFEVGSYQIKYKARDHVGNQASCTFDIVVSSVKCKLYDPPINGLVSCQFHNVYGGDLCTPSCELKKEFARIPAQNYVCLNSGTWMVFDNRPDMTQEMPWPDCTEEYAPGAARKGTKWQYFGGDCSDPAVQQQAKQNFTIDINEIFGAGDPNYCQKEKICQLENIRVTCGRTQKRRRKLHMKSQSHCLRNSTDPGFVAIFILLLKVVYL